MKLFINVRDETSVDIHARDGTSVDIHARDGTSGIHGTSVIHERDGNQCDPCKRKNQCGYPCEKEPVQTSMRDGTSADIILHHGKVKIAILFTTGGMYGEIDQHLLKRLIAHHL